jgi:eukaryotic-like serine/threonine-protein kinase
MPPQRRIGRYGIFGEIASGGMATVYFGRLIGAVGFSRSVAIKQLHPQYARSPEFVAQFLDEARLTARIRHPNVVQVLDVVARDGELFVIMEYVEGEPLSRLSRMARAEIPVPIVSSIVIAALLGLHAAHEATSENGTALEIVHRDVSPQNILVGIDGTSHILDFGVAKASSRVHTTENGQIKGKLAYMAPEQLRDQPLDRRADVFAMGVVLWELLTRQRLFAKSDPGATAAAVLAADVPPLRRVRPELSAELEAVVMKALGKEPDDRFATARDMALALEQAAEPASSLKAGAWVESVARDSIARRASLLRETEEHSSVSKVMSAESLQRSLAADGAAAPDGGLTTAAPVQADHIPPAPRSQRRRGLVVYSAAVAVAAIAAVAGYSLSASERGASPTLPVSAVQTETLPTLASDSKPEEPSPAKEEATPAAVIDLDPAPTALQQPKAGPVTAAGSKAPSTARRVSAKPAAGAANCNPPYVFDAKGHKRFKPECF